MLPGEAHERIGKTFAHALQLDRIKVAPDRQALYVKYVECAHAQLVLNGEDRYERHAARTAQIRLDAFGAAQLHLDG